MKNFIYLKQKLPRGNSKAKKNLRLINQFYQKQIA